MDFTCHICGFIGKNNCSLSLHLRNQHNISLLEYIIKRDNIVIPKCPYCGEDVKNRGVINQKVIFNTTCCSKNCVNETRKNYKASEETKEKLRVARINYMKQRLGNTAWELRNNRKMSYLENWFYNECILKNSLLSKYDIINEYCEFPYFIDFAFLNIKLAVELDGACHFNNGENRSLHDIKKDEFLISRGWKIYRIPFFEVNDTSISNFLKYLTNIQIYENKVFKDSLIKYKEIQYLKNIKKKENENFKKKLNRIELLINSKIDFTKKSWIKEASILTNVSTQKISAFIRKNIPQIWEICYKRKSTKL